MADYVDSDEIRTMFSRAMSDMYRSEVPLYGDLLELVHDVNTEALRKDPALRANLEQRHELARLSLERHGAIRVGTAHELAFLCRLFALMGMQPVGYYDLSTSGIPVHATAFRPIAQESLDKNPFRIFTSLLRPELIADNATRKLALDCLARRNIFTPKCVDLVNRAEGAGGRLSSEDANDFVQEALETFRWHSKSFISKETYDKLSRAHKLAADVCGFKSCHINHLTPRTLDIEAVQVGMAKRGIPPKAIIEGPPPLPCPVLLRQTSFLALSEYIEFTNSEDGSHVPGHHQARFGEIEQRGCALTEQGRTLYTRLMARAKAEAPPELGISPTHSDTMDINQLNEEHLLRYFEAQFPMTYEDLRRRGMGYFRYRVGQANKPLTINRGDSILSLDELITSGLVTYEPLIYEDFLPASAAGIFQSNLGQEVSVISGGPDKMAFESALGRQVIDEMDLYEASQQESLDLVAKQLGLPYSLHAQ